VFFCLGWDGFLIVWHGIAIASLMWFMSLFALIHTTVGIVLTYIEQELERFLGIQDKPVRGEIPR